MGDPPASPPHHRQPSRITAAQKGRQRPYWSDTTGNGHRIVTAPASRRGQATDQLGTGRQLSFSTVTDVTVAITARTGAASRHRTHPRPRAINSGGITRKGDAINIRLTDWTEHRSRPNQPWRTLRCIGEPSPPESGDGFLPSRHWAARQLEPGLAAMAERARHHRVSVEAAGKQMRLLVSGWLAMASAVGQDN